MNCCMRSILIVACAILLVQCAASRKALTSEINMDQAEQSATLPVQGTVHVLLPLPETGDYDWSLASPAVLSSFSSAYKVQGKPPVKKMIFKLNTTGTEDLRFLLKRSGSADVEQQKVLHLTIE